MGELLTNLDAFACVHPFIFWAGYLILLTYAAYWVRVTVLAWEGLRHAALNFLYVFAAVYLVVLGAAFILDTPRATVASPAIFLLGFTFFAAGTMALRRERPKRSRYIPKQIRDAVTKRDLKGKPFDSSKHHIDHRWPFSRWGGHTLKNLRVIPKKKNLQKGAKRPRWWELWR
jgi:hypothetical protein